MVFPFFKSKDREKQKMDPLLAAGLKGERSSNPQVSIKLAEHFLRENKRGLAVDEYLNAAQAFLEKRQMQLAMAVYRNIITIDPERYSVYETLADLYRNSGFPGDGASVLLALAYQYKKAGCDSEVKRTLDSVLDFAPDNPVLKRKVQAFFAAESHPGGSAPKPDISASKRVAAPAQQHAPVRRPDTPVPKPAAPAQVDIFALKPVAVPAQQHEPARRPDTPVPKPAASSQADIFALKPVAVPAQQHEPVSRPDIPAPKPAVPSHGDIFTSTRVAAPAEQQEPDATTRSFFDLQAALATDASLGFDYDSSSENLSSGDQEGSPFSVLNVVKNIALQDPTQDTPQFHLNLGIAYMQCGDYEQAVDELLSALYGIPDKIGCYVRLAECSLKLQRCELACGFLREALDCPDISPEQVLKVRKRLDELSAADSRASGRRFFSTSVRCSADTEAVFAGSMVA